MNPVTRLPLQLLLLFVFTLNSVASAPPAQSQKKPAVLTDAEVKREIIKLSIASYKGGCPCPYNTDRAGKSCGARSAYSRPGGAAPICYEKDVTAKMIAEYRNRKK